MSTPLFETCPLHCSQPLEETTIHLPEGTLRRCPSCGQLLSACDQDWYNQSMQEFNAPEGTLPQGKSQQRYQQRMSKVLLRAKAQLPYSAMNPRFLDVGCSSGALLQVAKRCDFSVHGVEPAEKAAHTASQLADVDVFTGFLADAHYPDHHFDIITLFEVIEHLTDPIAITQEMMRILKPGGILLIGTNNADSWSYQALGNRCEYLDIKKHGGHISFFTPNSMRKLAEQSGMRVINISTKRVNFAERKDVNALQYHFNRIARELLALPASWLLKGHDMMVTMQKPE